MVITFCGHSQFVNKTEYEGKVLSYLESLVGDSNADLFLGGYGDFDSFAYDCCKKFKKTHPKVSLIYVSPYYSISYQRNHLESVKARYDSFIYPEIKDKPLKFAITYRNRYMVDKADYIICFVDHDWGGAYQTYKYAKRKGKKIFNLAIFEE